MRNTIGLITARGGSKGLPGKNIMPLAGKPLIAYSIEAAREANLARVVLSTDSQEIADTAREHGCEVPFMRPASLASDSASSLDVILHAASELALDDEARIVLLQPTSPLRTAQDLTAALELFEEHSGAHPVIGVTRATKPLAWFHTMNERGQLTPRFPDLQAARRQDGGALFLPNGAIYIATLAQWRAGNLLDGALGYAMPSERAVDIDTALDFAMAEWILING